MLNTPGPRILMSSFLLFLIIACEKKDIQFATALGETYTDIIQVDTVGIEMTTFFVDSFATNAVETFSLGTYRDSILGIISAKPFLQLGLPDDLTIESGTVYDGLVLVVRFNGKSFGDSTLSTEFTVRELLEPLTYTYSNAIYNTSSFRESTVPLGIKLTRINPGSADSLVIELDNNKGLSIFQKMQQEATELQTADAFLSWFKGISIESKSSGTGNIYGIDIATDSLYIRLKYHTTTPYREDKYRDFKFNKSLFFNQILQDRSATLFKSSASQISSSLTGNKSLTQTSAGTLVKMNFPSLRNVLKIDPALKLLKATLVMEVSTSSYSTATPVPGSLFLAATDATNAIGDYLADSSGESQLVATPVVDQLYHTGTSYTFNVTNYINQLLITPGSENNGLFLLEDSPGYLSYPDRALIIDSKSALRPSKLILSLLTFNNKQ